MNEILYQTGLSQQFTKKDHADAGFDIHAAEDITVSPGGRAILVHTDTRVAIPVGWYGQIKPRSGLALKHDITVDGGVIDATYRGEVCVIMRNFGAEAFNVTKGMRIAQLVCIPCMLDASRVEDVPDTCGARGDNGFGSTGLFTE